MFDRFLGTQSSTGVGGVAYQRIADEFGTPSYILDVAYFKELCERFVSAAGEHKVSFASKANSAISTLEIARSVGLYVDVASEGELEAALRAGYRPHEITLHGNNKSLRELQRACELGVTVVIDNFREIDNLIQLGYNSVNVLLRVAPGVDPETHEAIRTGQEDTKFGFSLPFDALRAMDIIRRSPSLLLRGLHFHIGSQLMDSTAHIHAIDRVAAFCVENSFEPAHVCIGGGLGVRYTKSDQPQSIESHVDQILTSVRNNFPHHPSVGFEPGRCLVAEAGITLYTIGVRKVTARRTYLSIDGGLSDNPRPQLYGAAYTAFNASKAEQPHDTPFRVSGRHCETDTLIPEVMLPEGTKDGDLLAIQCTGAYNQSMASNYNRYPRPPLLLVEGGQTHLAVRRETLEDLFLTEVQPSIHR